MTAAVPMKQPMTLIDLPINKELDQSAMKQLAGGHTAGTTVSYSYYTTIQTQSIGFLKRHRRKYHHTRRTVQRWHTYGRWGRWHFHL